MTFSLTHPAYRDLVPDELHEGVDTNAKGYDPCLTLQAEGNRLNVKAQFEMSVPLDQHGIVDPLALVDDILDRLVLDMRIDGAAEIKAFLRANGRTIFPSVKGNA